MSTSRSPAAPCQPSSSDERSGGYMEPDPGLLFPVTRSSLLARRLIRLRAYSSQASSPVTRRKREMIPTDKKDTSYWDKRTKNNEAAKRSREKRRLSDLMLESQLLALSDENARLRAQMLSMQYHGSLRAEKSKAAAVSPRPAHSPALLQPGLWSNNPASVLGVRHQEASGFGSTRVLSPRAVLDAGRSEMDAQRQVSSSDDIHNSTDASSSIRAFDTLHHASILSPRNWLQVPHLNHSAVCNNFLLPWRSSYLAPPAVYPGLPLYIHEGRQGQGLGVEADMQGGFRSRFSSTPAWPSPLGMHLSPDGR
ncbi:uncharacterized protein LOC141768602 [Sebastes fasciatus]|uniref:uncharacterized protein LOC141768602 n=1 Tax=Sebastes fasciatus TaxID=394691 RepID=UPI003D9EAEE0